MTELEKISVASSDLKSIGYDLGSSTLEIEFLSGGIYQYFDVPRGEYEALAEASSHGKYFQANIKGFYRYERLR